jgi:hypothetical protein
MTLGRVRHACAAAIVVAAVVLPAAPVDAHPVDCDGNAVTAPPSAADWTGGNSTCTNPVALRDQRAVSTSATAPCSPRAGSRTRRPAR